MPPREIEIRELGSVTRQDFLDMGYGYTSNAKYAVRRVEAGGRITFAVELVSLDKPYVKVWPCPDDFIEDLREAIRHQTSFGAFDGDRLVGVAIARPRTWNNTLWVDCIHVHQDYRRRGIGERLMKRIEGVARDNRFRIIGLETQNTNAPAVAFYMKMGFVLDGFDVSFYSNNDVLEDEVAFFMKKPAQPVACPQIPQSL